MSIELDRETLEWLQEYAYAEEVSLTDAVAQIILHFRKTDRCGRMRELRAARRRGLEDNR